MLEHECQAAAAYVGELLGRSPLQDALPVPDERAQLLVPHLAELLTQTVQLSKRRVLEEVQAGRRAICVSLDAMVPDSLVALSADYAGIDRIGERLAFARTWTPKMFAGYVTVRETTPLGERVRVVYPAIQAALSAIEEALMQARQTPQGLYISTEKPDGSAWATVQKRYPAYYVYEVGKRPAQGGAGLCVERTGRDQLVAMLADAYHKGHWFAHEPHCAWNAF